MARNGGGKWGGKGPNCAACPRMAQEEGRRVERGRRKVQFARESNPIKNALPPPLAVSPSFGSKRSKMIPAPPQSSSLSSLLHCSLQVCRKLVSDKVTISPSGSVERQISEPVPPDTVWFCSLKGAAVYFSQFGSNIL